MRVTLTVHGQEKDGQKFVFDGPGSLLFGRSEKAQCRVVNDPYVSRAHFLLLINPPEVRLRNLSQTNGTEVDGKLFKQTEPAAGGSETQTLVKGEDVGPAAEAELHNGSQIEVGYTRISVAIEGEQYVYCGECGSPIPAAQKAIAAEGQRYLCPNCREAWHRIQEQERQPQHPLQMQQKPGASPPGLRSLRLPRDPLVDLILRRLGIREFRGSIPSIPGFEVVRELGRGAMGVVVEAKRVSDGREVAIKLVKPDRALTDEARSRFRREIRILRELQHPHVIEFLDGGEAKNLLWLAMEFVPNGYDLLAHLKKRGGRIPRQEAIDLVVQVLEGLAFAHGVQKIIHRDIKPPNILLLSGGANHTAKLSDFGLGKSLEDSGVNGSVITKPAACMGTLPYMPPEQARDARTATTTADVFSIGATLYHVVTGQFVRDFSRRQNEAIRQVVMDPVVPIRERDSSIPATLASVIDRSLSLEPDARYGDAGEFKIAIEAAMR